jgi:hypothetical protein
MYTSSRRGARHQHPVALDAAIEIAAILMLLEESPVREEGHAEWSRVTEQRVRPGTELEIDSRGFGRLELRRERIDRRDRRLETIA